MQAIAAYGAAFVAPAQSREVLSAKSKALRMVNERLVKVDDPLIYAVSILWMFEVSFLPGGLVVDSTVWMTSY
jgi:hypothetical protein